ncbi:MAG: HD domain-containing protein [Chloroflexi bacterium]|nr:HD domain-containing protein [Chloroflexota bacterium]
MSVPLSQRFRQMGWALTAPFTPLDHGLIEQTLGAAALVALFERMRPSERLHGLRVMQTLKAAGYDHPDLMVAALLHDVGKSRYGLNLLDRVIIVILRRLWPAWAKKAAQGSPNGWRRALVISEQHPIWSAEDLKEAGASPLAVRLARCHANPVAQPPQNEEDRLLAALQWADDLN